MFRWVLTCTSSFRLLYERSRCDNVDRWQGLSLSIVARCITVLPVRPHCDSAICLSPSGLFASPLSILIAPINTNNRVTSITQLFKYMWVTVDESDKCKHCRPCSALRFNILVQSRSWPNTGVSVCVNTHWFSAVVLIGKIIDILMDKSDFYSILSVPNKKGYPVLIR